MAVQTVWRWRLAIMLSLVGSLGALLRFAGLASPNALVFDEVYYVRGAYSLMTLGYEGDWSGDNQAFVSGDYSGLSTAGDFVVHPMVGKLLIQFGMEIFGVNPFGWRVVTATLGTITVLLVALIARHLFRSTLWGGVAGLLIAIEGQAIVMSRTALLDGFLAFFVVAGLGLVVVDRAHHARRLTTLAARDRSRLRLAPEDPIPGWGAVVGIRWWRLGAVVALGLAVSVKWSGLYFAVVFMVLSVVFDLVDRRRVGYASWISGAVLRAVPTALASIAIIAAIYIGTWYPWFATDGSYARHWAEDHPGEGVLWLPDSLRSLAHYHRQMWDFHTGLTSPHNYSSNPWGWLLQIRPTLLYVDRPDGSACGAASCTSGINAIGNLLVWWAGALAFFYAAWRFIARRDLLALTVSAGVIAGWVPWLPYAYRTVFLSYTVAIAPFLVLTLVWALRRIASPGGQWSRTGTIAVAGFVGACLVWAGFYVPAWLNMLIPSDYWTAHMLLYYRNPPSS